MESILQGSREPTVPRTPPFQETYGFPNPSLRNVLKINPFVPIKGKGSGNRRFPEREGS